MSLDTRSQRQQPAMAFSFGFYIHCLQGLGCFGPSAPFSSPPFLGSAFCRLCLGAGGLSGGLHLPSAESIPPLVLNPPAPNTWVCVHSKNMKNAACPGRRTDFHPSCMRSAQNSSASGLTFQTCRLIEARHAG